MCSNLRNFCASVTRPPLQLSRNMLHGWKDNSMLVKPLAAYARLSSTVSQLFEPQVEKNRSFHVPQPTAAHIFVSRGDAAATVTQYVPWMERQFNACQTPRSIYLSSIVSELYDESKNGYFYHIFVSPGISYLCGGRYLTQLYTYNCPPIESRI